SVSRYCTFAERVRAARLNSSSGTRFPSFEEVQRIWRDTRPGRMSTAEQQADAMQNLSQENQRLRAEVERRGAERARWLEGRHARRGGGRGRRRPPLPWHERYGDLLSEFRRRFQALRQELWALNVNADVLTPVRDLPQSPTWLATDRDILEMCG